MPLTPTGSWQTSFLKSASYVLTVKGKQKSFKQQLADLFKHTTERFPELIYTFEQHDKGHRRLEYRKISVLATTPTEIAFPDVKQIALLHREREVVKTGKKSSEDVYLITDIDFDKLDAEKVAKLKRG